MTGGRLAAAINSLPPPLPQDKDIKILQSYKNWHDMQTTNLVRMTKYGGGINYVCACAIH